MSRGLWPRRALESPKSAPRSPKRVKKESEAVFLDSFRTPGRTLRGLLGSGHPFGLFSDSFGVPGPKGPGALCARPGSSQNKGDQCRGFLCWLVAASRPNSKMAAKPRRAGAALELIPDFAKASKLTLKAHTPQIFGGEDFTPQTWGVSVRKHSKISVFEDSPPKFGG